jgi:dihydrofolate reductase
MSKVCCDIAISVDGYVAGPNQSEYVAIAGGAATINDYLAAGHIDELRLHIAPVTVGAGERPFDGVPGQPLELVAARSASRVTHVTYRITP